MMVFYAILCGLSASWASILGKISGLEYDNINIMPEYALRVCCIVCMVALNSVMWALYVKALQASKSSLEPTIIVTATNYVSSGLFGYLLFGEVTGVWWWSGVALMIVGVGLIVKSSGDEDKNK